MSTTIEKIPSQPLAMKLVNRPVTWIKKEWRKSGPGYLFLAPFLILFLIFTVIPVFTSFFLSFTYYNMLQPAKWFGLTNFRVLLMEDEVFLIALKNTLFFALVSGPIGYVASFLFAWVIHRLRFGIAFTLAFYAPSLTSGIAMSVVWMVLFSADRYGYINNFLLRMGIIGQPILWNMNPQTIMPIVILISVWMSMGTGFLVFLAGFKGVNRQYYEAARIDGVKRGFQELWHIAIPMVKPQMLFGAINSIVLSFGVFDIAVAVTTFPSPNYAAHTIVAHLVDHAFIRFEMGYASTIAVFLFLITFLLGRICFRLLGEKT